MPPKNWVSSGTDQSKRQRVVSLEPLPVVAKGSAKPTDIHNHGSIQNQAVTQTIHGSQFFGNVSIHNHAATGEPNHGPAEPNEDLLASLAFPGMLDRRDNILQPHADTCQWIFDLKQYCDWIDQPRGMLWIKGKPGSGKSTLMSSLHRRLRQQRDTGNGVHLDFFFHARGSELQSSRLGMLRSLLNQLLRQCPQVGSDALASYREKSGAYGSAVHRWEWQLPELERIFFEAVIESSVHQQVTVFVDALDEAGTGHARAVASYLHKINDRATSPPGGNTLLQLKICISSRHYPVEPVVQSVEICMENHNAGDIERFVHDEINQVMLTTDRPFIQSHWKQLAIDVLQHAKGVFQWVRLVLQLVIVEFEHGWLIQDTSSFFKKIPKDLEEVYTYILQSIIKYNRISESLLLFQWVCFAEEPLTPTELMCALAPLLADSTPQALPPDLDEQSIKRRIRSLSGGLIEVANHARERTQTNGYGADDTEIVQVIHQTVLEYLMGGGLTLLWSYCEGSSIPLQPDCDHDQAVLSQRCHSTLYWCCLNYLAALQSRTTDSNILDSMFEGVMEQMFFPGCRRLRTSLSTPDPFTTYATLNLFEHARKALRCRNATNDFLPIGSEHELEKLERIRTLWQIIYVRDVPDDFLASDLTQVPDSLLHIAAYFNVTSLVHELIDRGRPIDEEDSFGRTALHVAAFRGHLEICKILQSAGMDINMVPTSSESSLALAIERTHYEIVSWLLEKGADVNIISSGKKSSLVLAAESGELPMVKLLIEAGADLNIQSPSGETVLQVIASYGEEEVAHQSINVGSNVNTEDGDYYTALHAAVIAERLDIVQLLIDAGADVDAQSSYHGTALQKAARDGNIGIIRLLVTAGANVNIQGGIYGSALGAAAYTGEEKIVQILINAGADVNLWSGGYGSALHMAASNGWLDIVRTLVTAGADVNIQGGQYNTTLQAAALGGYSDIVQLLIDAGADVNTETDHYGTALRQAAREGNLDLIRRLVAAGAKLLAGEGPGGRENSIIIAKISQKNENGHKDEGEGQDHAEDGGSEQSSPGSEIFRFRHQRKSR